MCCGHTGPHGHFGFVTPHPWCLCFPRRFISSTEERERLDRYREQLKKELAGVEERLKEMG